MSAAEAKEEILIDLKEVLAKVDSCSKKFRRVVLKTTQFPLYIKPIEFISKRKNKWLILLEAKNRKNANESLVTFVCISDSRIGYHAFMPTSTNGRLHIIMYPPHFFSRYRDRFCNNLTGIPLVAEYFKYNNNYVFEFNEQKPCVEVYGSSAHGVALGLLAEENIFLMKTFVSYEMLKGEQVNKFAAMNKIREEIHE